MLFVAAAWFILSFVIGSAANQRGRSAVGWFLVSIFTTPLLAGVFLLLFPSLRDPASVDDKALQESIRKGPHPGTQQKRAVARVFISLAIVGSVIFLVVKGGGRNISQVNEQTALTQSAPERAQQEIAPTAHLLASVPSPSQKQTTLVPRGSEKPSFECAK